MALFSEIQQIRKVLPGDSILAQILPAFYFNSFLPDILYCMPFLQLFRKGEQKHRII